MVSTHPPISTSSNPFTRLLVIVPSAPSIISITVTFMFQIFIFFSSKVLVLVCLLAFTLSSAWEGKVHNSASSLFFSFFFFLLSLRILLSQIFWAGLGDLFVSQNPRKICAFSSPGRIIISFFFLFWVFFTPALANGFYTGVQVTPSLQDSSQYSGRSQ